MGYNWYNDITDTFMKKGYLDGMTIDEKVNAIAKKSESILGIEGFADKIVEDMKNGYYIWSTPIWKNFYIGSDESPISCYGLVVPNSIKGIMSKASEVAMQNKIGGGTSGSFHLLQGRGTDIGNGNKGNGAVSFMEIFQTVASVISQPNRRGHFSATLPITHPDIKEFLRCRYDGHPIQQLSTSVSIPDSFMLRLLEGDEEVLEVTKLMLESRFKTGFPYVFFEGNVNKHKPSVYLNDHIHHSNMCHEICLPNSPEESFVCNIMGLNLEKIDEILENGAVERAIYFMDSMITDFIEKNEGISQMASSVKFAKEHRAMGLGASGLHSYLQSKGIAFESDESFAEQTRIFKEIKRQSYEASEKMAKQYGEPEKCKGIGRRHTTLNAIAPNTSSAFIVGQQSQSVEPFMSNYYLKQVVNNKIPVKNKYLEARLEELGKNTEEVWTSILKNNGSVQHLDFLKHQDKLVFKTFGEMDMKKVILGASVRQQYIDQSQSLNLIAPLGTQVHDTLDWLITAWELGVKTLYYQLNVSAVQEFGVAKLSECESCAG